MMRPSTFPGITIRKIQTIARASEERKANKVYRQFCRQSALPAVTISDLQRSRLGLSQYVPIHGEHGKCPGLLDAWKTGWLRGALIPNSHWQSSEVHKASFTWPYGSGSSDKSVAPKRLTIKGNEASIIRIAMVWPRHPASVPEVILTNLDGLYRFACRLTKDADRAQDLVQETALRALQRERTIVRDPRAWLFQTLYHTFISDYRRLSREAINDRFSEEELDLQNLCGPLSDAVAMEDVRKAVEALPDELRSVVWLSDAEGFRVREIAEILGWPIGTVGSRLWRARQELRVLLSVYRPPEEQEYDMR